MSTLEPLPLPAGITEAYVDCTDSCGLNFHVLQAGTPGQPLLLFAHGFPEIAYSWRKVLVDLSKGDETEPKGYYCVAMDQRGYGRTTGWDTRPYHECDMRQWTISQLVQDIICLVYRLGYTEVHSIIGHDFGGVTSAMSALIRPDMFKSTVQLSHPHHAPAAPPLGDAAVKPKVDIQAELAKLDPPRKHYKWYNSTPEAADHWNDPPQKLERYLRGYFHLKSADWNRNDPHPLKDWSAKGLEEMPEYYIMKLEHSFPEAIASNMTGEDYSKTNRWLSEEELAIYCKEWQRTGFQGALNWYRMMTSPEMTKEMYTFAGARLPKSCFISGAKDWGNYQQPDSIENYEKGAVTFIEGAGHWVQQEQPQAVIVALQKFLRKL